MTYNMHQNDLDIDEAYREDYEGNEWTIKINGMEKYLRRQLNDILTSQKAVEIIVKSFLHFNYEQVKENATFQNGVEIKIDNLYDRWLKAI